MPELRAKAILFDMDGTLVDSTALVEATWAHFCDRHDLHLPTVLDFAHGRPTRSTVEHFLCDRDVIEAEVERLVAHEESETTGIVEVPGARHLIDSLPPGSWAVVTSATRKLAGARLAAAGIPVPETLICYEDVQHGKPHPQGFLIAAAALGVDPAECLAFEDSPTGVRAALASGAQTVVVGDLEDNADAVTRLRDFTDIAGVSCEPGSAQILLAVPSWSGA